MKFFGARYRKARNLAVIVIFTIAAMSLLFPYKHRLESSDSTRSLEIDRGFEMLFAIVSLVLIAITGTIALLIRRKWSPLIAFFLVFLNLLTQFLVKWEIHFEFKGFVDTKSGIGFYMLATCSVLLFLICFIDLFSIPHYVPVRKKNPTLIDELEL